MKSLGQLIVIEGASDGMGKTTQLERLKEHLESDGVRIASHHFPTYYSYQGQGVERYLSGEFGSPDDLSPYFVNSLFAYDRAITWRNKLKALYEKGRTILLDRYTTSSLIYQSAVLEGQARRDFIDYVMDFEYNKLGIKQPDKVIFLYAPFDLITKMRQARTDNEGIKDDVYERNLDLLKKAYDNAMSVAEYLNWTMINCATPGGTKMRTIESIHQDIYKAIK